MHQFRNLDVWRRAVEVADMTYDATEGFPREETFGLQSQMRRAAVSISSNIAEGAGTSGHRAFARYLRISYGSACELETQTVIAARRGLIDEAISSIMLGELDGIRRMLNSLISRPR